MIRKFAGLAALVFAASIQAGTLTLTLDNGLSATCGSFTNISVDGQGNASATGGSCTSAGGTGPYTVTGVVSPAAGGSIAITPTGQIPAGNTATATVTLNAGYSVTSWTGVTCTTGGGTTNTCGFTVNSNVTVTANVSNGAATYTVSATASGGSATFAYSPTGPYAAGSNVTVTATPAAGYSLISWTGCSSFTGATCTITNIQGNTAVVANLQATGGGSCGTTPANVTVVQTAAPTTPFTRKAYYPAAGVVYAFQLVPMTGTPTYAYTAEATKVTGAVAAGRTMIISECPGSRTPAATSDCVKGFGEASTLYFANATGPGFCNMASNKTYYVNVFPDNNANPPVVACNSTSSCAFYFLTR